ncbi:MAG TPA: hypothetical protein VGF01_14430 [Terracidiphilus sp.]
MAIAWLPEFWHWGKIAADGRFERGVYRFLGVAMPDSFQAGCRLGYMRAMFLLIQP